MFVVAIARPGSIVRAPMEGLNVLQGGATGLGEQEGGISECWVLDSGYFEPASGY